MTHPAVLRKRKMKLQRVANLVVQEGKMKKVIIEA